LDRDHDESVRGDEEEAQEQKDNKKVDDLDLENVGDATREEIYHENSVPAKSSLETDALS
jgi:hypothetical protein